jgi:hypothetical protein
MSPAALRTGLFLVVLLGVASPAVAQDAPRGHAFAGVSALRDLGTEDVPAVDYDRGWIVAAGVRLPWWRLVAVGDLSQHSRTNIVDETQRLLAALGGVRVDLVQTSRVTWFAQALAGLERFAEPGFAQSGPAFQPGTGVDVAIWSRVGVRAQADVRLSRQNDATYEEVRGSAGIVWGW